jgi:hypothetical protein
LDPTKDKPTGAFVEAWLAALQESGLESVTVDLGFSQLLAVKDAKELVCFE